MASKQLKLIYMLFIYCFLYAPIIVLIIYSFNNSTYSSLWHGFTTVWYKKLFHNYDLLLIAQHSIILASLAASLACLFGALIAIHLYKNKMAGKKIIFSSLFVLIVLPDIVLGVALMLLFFISRINFGFFTLLVAHTAFCMPFVIITVYSRLIDLDKNLFEAATDLGATELTLIRKVILPLIKPALIASWLLCFTLSMDDVIVSFFVSGPSYQILPLQIYSMVRLGIKPEINALCSILFGFTVLFIIIAYTVLNSAKHEVKAYEN